MGIPCCVSVMARKAVKWRNVRELPDKQKKRPELPKKYRKNKK
jgi:hypothetical protein